MTNLVHPVSVHQWKCLVKKMHDMKEILLLVLFWAGSISAQNTPQDISRSFDRFIKEQDSLRKTHVGKEYPAKFQFMTLEGDTVNEKMLSGKVTFFNFWFESCAPCVAEFGALDDLYRKYKDNPDFRFVTFSTDRPEDIKKTLRKHDLHFPVCHISRSEVAKMNFNQGFPTNIVIGKDRTVLYLFSGGPIEDDRAREMVKKIERIICENL